MASSLSSPPSGDHPKHWLGYLAAGSVAFIWAAWLVASRSGALSSLSVFDLAALRYGISGVLCLPIVLYYKPWRTISIFRMLILAMLLGPLYIICVFQGFVFAPVSHGGIFMNGALPAITLFIGWVGLSEKATTVQLVGLFLILLGAALTFIGASDAVMQDSWKGDLLFLLAAMFFAGYLVVGGLWKVSSTQVLFSSSVINAFIYVPIWYFFLPSGLNELGQTELLVQALFQGVIPTLGGLLLVAYAVRTIGSAASAAFMAAVPSLGTLLGYYWLGETVGFWGWISIAVLTPGIIMVAAYRRR